MPGVAEDADQMTAQEVPYDPKRVTQIALRQDASLDEDLVLRLIEDEVLTPAQLEQIRKSVQPRRSKRRKGGPP